MQFRLLVEAVQDYAIFMLDPAGNITSWNAGAERIKRYKASEIIGKHFSNFYPEEDIRHGKPAWELIIADEKADSKMKAGGYEKMARVSGRMWSLPL